GWHSPPGVGHLRLFVLAEHRERGAGTKLLDRLSTWLGERECAEATATVSEDDSDSLEWAARRGFEEVGRNSIMALDLTAAVAPEPDPPSGIEIVTWSERPDLISGVYEVYLEASPDVPGEEEVEISSFEEWLVNDMQGAGDRSDATFIAVSDGAVVGYAKL